VDPFMARAIPSAVVAAAVGGQSSKTAFPWEGGGGS